MKKTTETSMQDPLTESFLRSDREIFRSVSYPTEVWKEDLCDVETIHCEAREVFDRLLTDAVDPFDPRKVGRMLLLLGESGAGKTHLMRAFRTRTHSGGAGYFGYMQMTSHASNYGRYVLRMLIDSLQKPYSPRLMDDEPRGLKRLSNALVERKGNDRTLLERLRNEKLSHDEVTHVVHQLTIQIVNRTARNTNPDLVRALLFLQTEDAHAHGLVIKYLRAESLSQFDQNYLAGVTPLDSEEDAVGLILGLGQLMWDLQKAALVICVDQIEDMFLDSELADQTRNRFLHALMTLRQVAEHLPSAIVIVSCLEDFYYRFREELPQPLIDRIQNNPPPITLIARRSRGEVEDMVWAHLYQLMDDTDEETLQSINPIPEKVLKSATDKRSREVLDLCRRYRDQCVTAGYLVQPQDIQERPNMPGSPGETRMLRLESEWNDFLAAWETEPSESEEKLLHLLEQTIQNVSHEHEGRFRFDTQLEGQYLSVAADKHDIRRRLRICNAGAQGGGLTRQVSRLRKSAAEGVPEAAPVIVRMTDYRPKTPNSKIAAEYAAIVQAGGFPLTIDDSDWRRMAAFLAFSGERSDEIQFDDWKQTMQPLSRIESLQRLLSLDRLKEEKLLVPQPEEETSEDVSAPQNEVKIEHHVQTPTSPINVKNNTGGSRTANSELLVGSDNGNQEKKIEIESLKRHAAFLGGTGSGKTTAALNLLEQLLMQDIPVIMIDRKGDLAAFADPQTWDRPALNRTLSDRQRVLKDSVDVSLYTPGHTDGCPLSLSVVPEQLKDVPEGERQIICRDAADALGSIMNYGKSKADRNKLSVLIKTIEMLSCRNTGISLNTLIQHTYNPDDELIASLGILDPKHCEKVAEDLQMLGINNAHLFPENGETLNADLLFRKDEQKQRTKLSIISTKFLGNDRNIEFWVAQLLLELNRWCSRNPSPTLQAVVMFDEADLYLPATRKPATKEPMESLLKRARSAGLGVFLATQSPGDMDYRCRDNINTWMIGSIGQQTAIDKIKPLLSNLRMDVSKKLKDQRTGEFFFCHGDSVSRVISHRSLMETTQLSEEEILKLANQTCALRKIRGGSA